MPSTSSGDKVSAFDFVSLRSGNKSVKNSMLKLNSIILFFLGLILFIPLFIIPGFLYPALFGKTVLFQLIIEALLILGLVFVLKTKGHQVSKFIWTPGVLAVALYFLIRLIAGIFGDNPSKSFWGEQMRMGGNFTYLHFLGFFILLLFFIKGERLWLKFLKINGLAGVFIALFAIIHNYLPAGDSVFSGSGQSIFDHRIYGSFGNPIFLASYAVFQAFLCLFLSVKLLKEASLRIKRTWIWPGIGFAAALLNAFIVFLTQTRGALIALIFSAFLFFCFLIWFKLAKIGKIYFLAVFAVILALSLAVFLTQSEKLEAKFSDLGDTAATRLLLWNTAFKGFLAKPILGWGPENFELVFDKFYPAKLIQSSFYETWADRPHNLLLEVAATTGTLGVLSYLSIFGAVFWIIFKKRQNGALSSLEASALLTGFSAYFIQNLFAFDTTGSLLVFIFALAYISGINRAAAISSSQFPISNPFSNYKSQVFLVSALLLLFLPFSFQGNIKSLRASFYANRLPEDFRSNNAALYASDFTKALERGNPYRNEIAKMLADDLMKADAAKIMPPKLFAQVLSVELQTIKEVAEFYPNVFNYVYRLGQVLSLAGERLDPSYFNEAEKYLNQAQILSPKRQVVSGTLAQLKLLTGRADEAETFLKELIKENPEVGILHWFLGVTLAAQQKSDEAIQSIEEAVRQGYKLKFPNEITYFIDLYDKQGEYEKIIYWYQVLAGSDWYNAQWRAGLAATYAQLGRKEDARREAERAALLDPTYLEEARQFLRDLEK